MCILLISAFKSCLIFLINDGTFLVRFGGISGEFGLVMVTSLESDHNIPYEISDLKSQDIRTVGTASDWLTTKCM